MAKKIKFALKLKDGAEVRTLEELRQAFDLEAVIGYWSEGKLGQWLKDRYYEEEAEAVGRLNKDTPEFCEELCKALQVPYEREETVDVEELELRRERLRRLKEVTEDEEVLSKVDQVAFDQEELADRLDEGWDVIYLCGKDFHIPEKVGNRTYIPVHTELDIEEEKIEKYQKCGIKIVGVTDKITRENQEKEKVESFTDVRVKEDILALLNKYQKSDYRINFYASLHSKVSKTIMFSKRNLPKYSAEKEAKENLKKVYNCAERFFELGNRDSLSKILVDQFLKTIEPDIITIQNILEKINDDYKNRNKVIIEEIRDRIKMRNLEKRAKEEAEKELMTDYYQNILNPLNWYEGFINYEEWETFETGFFKNKYEYSYEGYEAYDLIEKDVDDAIKMFREYGTNEIKSEVISPIVELVKRLEGEKSNGNNL